VAGVLILTAPHVRVSALDYLDRITPVQFDV
jgi:hypothetical protein